MKSEDVWCHFPQGLCKDRSNPGRSPEAGIETAPRNLCPGRPRNGPAPAPVSPRPGTRSQPGGLANPERGVEEGLLGVVPRVREPGC